MTYDEWQPIAALIDNLWKDDFDDARGGAYYAALEQFPPEAVRRAVLNLAGSPKLTTASYSPSAQEIATATNHVLYIGTYQWALGLMGQLLNAAREEALLDPDAGPYYVPAWKHLPDAARRRVLTSDPVYGPQVLALAESFGDLQALWHFRSQKYSYIREVRHRWAHLTLQLATATTSLELVRA